MYLISNRDLELVIRALEVLEFRNGEPWRIRETKRMAKLLVRKFRAKKPVESFTEK